MDDILETGIAPTLNWSRIWSPLVPNDVREEAWQQLLLPDTFEEHETIFWSSLHTGYPAPKVPMLFHAILGIDGAGVREDWMRATQYLGLKSNQNRLPPDHLGSCSEVLAFALRKGEPVLVSELCSRFFLPWCERARKILDPEEDQLVLTLCDRFQDDLNTLLAELPSDQQKAQA